ncbi:nuclear transport factor 2 family protein [Nocardia sp. NPDC051570]|uniref:nuclear transport factor 2 family protein n=1 Tax=Nocardia sp. NPDC051570 TaxID=3364324 RepID=UPI0037B5ABFB
MIATINEYFARSSAKDFDGMLKLCTDDVEMRIPYQPPGFPNKGTGKAEVRQMSAAAERYDRVEQRVVSAEPMLDPNGWLVETKGDMVVRSTGRPYRNDYLNVVRFRDGKIAEIVTYHDSVAMLVAFDMIKDLPAPPEI